MKRCGEGEQRGMYALQQACVADKVGGWVRDDLLYPLPTYGVGTPMFLLEQSAKPNPIHEFERVSYQPA